MLPSDIRAVDVPVEPDLSNAAPFVAAALVTGGRVTVPGWPARTTQAGDALREIVTLMGGTAELDRRGPHRDRHRARCAASTTTCTTSASSPPRWPRCAWSPTPPRTCGASAHIRGHETDRIAALATEFNSMGGHVTETDDGLTIRPSALNGGPFRTYADHRMAHAGVILGLAVPGVQVEDVATTVEDLPGLRRRLVEPVRAEALMPRYDEYDVESYDRPRRHTRPRTKDRPTYDDAVEGRVVTVDRGRYTTLVDDHLVSAMKSRPLGRKGVVVGDEVRLVGDVSGADGSLARIVEVDERRSVLRRTADDDDPVERVIVANADQLVVVAALADPEPRPRLIDRALVAAYDAGLDPLLCLTKADLADPETLLSIYRPLDVPYVVTQRGGDLSRCSATGCTGRSACSSGTAGSASPRSSTRWCPAATGPSGTSTRSPAAAGTPRRRR